MSTLYFQPPPTYADPVIVEETTGHASFNPLWLGWFLELAQVLSAAGGGGGAFQHNLLGGLQGGAVNQYYHFTASDYTDLTDGGDSTLHYHATDRALANATGILASTNGGTANGFTKFTGPTTAEKVFTLPDANATLLYSGGPLGTPSSGIATNLTGTAASLNVGTAATWTTARNLAGNSVNGSANVAFANKFIVQGTTDTGLSAAQFLGALGTGIIKNTATTGVLSIAVAADFPALNQNTSGTAAGLSVVLVPASGGTGIANNNASTLTISGNFATTLTVSGITGVTLPTSGTLATLAGSEEFTNKTLNASVGKGTWTASGTWTLPALTLGGAITYGGVTLTNNVTGTGKMVLDTSPTLATPTIGVASGSSLFVGGADPTHSTSNPGFGAGSQDSNTVMARWTASGGGADAKIWEMHTAANTFNGRTVNDAYNSATNWLTVTRSGTSISSILFPTLSISGAIAKIGNITTSGVVGAPAIVATGRSAAQTAAVASVSAFTVGSSDASFEVSANVNVTTATTHNFTVTCAYTDEGNTARTLTFGFVQLTGSTFITAITNLTGAGPYESPLFHIRCKASTTITIATTGTFTLVTYNVEGLIKQMA